jgi:membrane protein required for colicin V production
MTLLDAIFAVAVLISTLLAMKRGFVREIVTVGALALAMWLALLAYRLVLVPYGIDLIGTVLGCVGAFVVALIVLMFVGRRLSDAIEPGFGGLNGPLGALFGLARGAALVVLGLMYVDWILLPDERPVWMTGALSVAPVRAAGEWLITIVPGLEIVLAAAIGSYLSLMISFVAVLIGRRRSPPKPTGIAAQGG